MTARDGLSEIGFGLMQESRDGTRQYAKRANPYLVYWLVGRRDGTAELTWEFSLGQYLKDRGFAVSGQDELSLLLFPRDEIKGSFDVAWVASALEKAEAALASLDFAAGR